MNFLKKITVSFMVITLMLGTLGSAIVGAEESKDSQKRVLEDQLGIEMSNEDFELASLIGKYTEFDHSEKKVTITNKSALAQELKNFDGVNVGDVVSGFNSANSYLASIENDSDFGVMSLCSNALGILGLAHGTSLSVAAGILGVAWYIAVPIVTAAGAIWVAGSIACP